jgi:hypothetical protein
MIQLTAQSHIMVAILPQDFRRGIDGFAGLCRNTFQQNPQDGTFFVFINRAKTMIRILAYDGQGYWLMTKRLSKGRFNHWPKGANTLTPMAAKYVRQIIDNTDSTECSFFEKKLK